MRVWVGSGGPNVCSHLPLLNAQPSGRDYHAQNHTGDAGQFYTRAGMPGFEFGAACMKWCALLQVHILSFQSSLPSTSPILTQRAPLEPENSSYSSVLRLGNGEVGTKLCLADPIWPPSPQQGVARWWGWPCPEKSTKEA